jgi:hypothetical protein
MNTGPTDSSYGQINYFQLKAISSLDLNSSWLSNVFAPLPFFWFFSEYKSRNVFRLIFVDDEFIRPLLLPERS